MKKIVIDCTNKTQKYVELTNVEVKEIRDRQASFVPPPEPESLENKIRRIVKEELNKNG